MIDTNALRKKVLDLAIRGKLVPQNPNDEPASVLLERIREEKQRLIREGKIKKDKVDSIIFRGEDNCHYEKIGNNEPVLFEDLPFEIPANWSWVRFSSLIKVISGVSYDKHDICNKGIRILRGGNINNFNVFLEEDDVFLPDEYYDEEKQVQINDILIVASTGSKLAIGKAGYVITNLENTQIGAFLRIVRPLFEEFAEYIKTIFATNYYKEHILDSIRGSNINNLKNEHISNLLIPVPPIEEQSRIVRYIKEIFTQIDLIEKNQSDYNSLVETLKKAILQSAIQGKLVEQDNADEPAGELLARIRAEKKAQLGKKYIESYIYKGDDNRYYEKIGTQEPILLEFLPFEIPSSWTWARLSTVVDINPRNAIPDDLEVAFVEMKAIKDGFNNEFLQEHRLWKTVKAGFTHFQNGDIGFAKITPCFENRKSVLFDGLKNGYGAGTTELHILRSNKSFLFPEYILYFVKSQYLIDYGLEKYSGNAGQQRFGTSDVKQTLIPIPPYNEQIRICTRIKHILDSIKDEV